MYTYTLIYICVCVCVCGCGCCCCYCSVVKSHLTLWLLELQHARLPYPSLFPKVCSNSYPLSWWYHPIILSSAIPFLLLPSNIPSISVFSSELALHIRGLKYWNFSFSISPSMNIQGWFPSGLTGLISLPVQGTLKSLLIWKHQFFSAKTKRKRELGGGQSLKNEKTWWEK